ncbi:GIY-YIG nuclease family protein [Candidatus Kaiserbacteria bacterium]|nr:GIY-YIG nuclease family protein [Candidatus Kaiserbacteria bacterium]
MYYVYTLYSTKDTNLYVGRTNNLRRRLAEHNDGVSFATAPRRPFRLVYYEAYMAEADAAKREKNLKLRGQARQHLMTRLEASLRQAQS